MTVLQLSDIHKSFSGPDGAIAVLAGAELTVAAGETVSVRGRSGSGKSTLLAIAGALMKPTRGSVHLAGEALAACSPARRARLRGANVGFVFQQSHLLPYLDVADNIRSAGIAAKRRIDAQRIESLLTACDLSDRRHHRPAQLSIGQQQRASLARALAHRPTLLLADEPTGNLDAANAELVWRLIADFARDGGAALVVSHDERVASRCDRCLHLSNGRLHDNEDPDPS